MQKHLEEISKCVASGAHAIVLMDGAGWHKGLELPNNLTPLIIPPYSPELNPVENIWQFLRDNYLSNLVWENYEAILDRCCEAWNLLTAETGRIASIATRKWAVIKSD